MPAHAAPAADEDEPPPDRRAPHYGPIHWLALFAILGLFGWLYVHLGDILISQTNPDPLRSDQKHNMALALRARDQLNPNWEQEGLTKALRQWVPHYTDGVVNPLWPWAAARVAPEGMTESGPAQTTDADREFFRLGKWLNVVLTGAFLLLLGMYLGRTFTLLGTVNLVVLIGLAAFLPRSAYFQPEPLYYIYFFLTWAVSLAVLKHNQVWLYAVLGLAAGLAYLAKASVAPLLVVFLLASTYRFFGAFFPLLLGGGGDGRHHGSEWSCLNHFIGLVFLAFTYLLTTGPRLEYAHSYYGDPFHTYPSYWMWMESFDEGYAWMNEHPTKEQLDAIPEDKVPSLENYLATHTGAEVWGRLRDGVGYVVTRFLNPPERVQKADDPRPWNHVLTHRGYYLAYLTLALVLTGLFYTRHRKASIFPHQRVDPAAVPVILFVLGAVAAYALAYGWYAPIGKGDRFMLALYGPLAFSLMAGAESLILRVRRRGECLWILHTYTALQAVLAAALAFRIVQIFQNPRFGG